jgi:hypothetical protein
VGAGLGLLPTARVVNPANGRRITVVSRDDMEAFRAEYVSLAELAAERGTAPETMADELEAMGVRPALNPEAYKARLYLRSDVAKD